MNWLEILQTVGICLNSVLLLAIAYMMFTLVAALIPPTQEELEKSLSDMDVDASEDELVIILQGKTHEEIDELLQKKPPPGRKRGKRRK